MLFYLVIFLIAHSLLPLVGCVLARYFKGEVDNLAAAVSELDGKGVKHEPIRTDEYTGKQFVFFSDPDGLPIELYEK